MSVVAAVLAFAACWLLVGGSSRRRILAGQPMPGRVAGMGGGKGRAVVRGAMAAGRTHNSLAAELHEIPLFVHQLTALLQAGRSPQMLWQDVLAAYRPGTGMQQDPAAAHAGFAGRVVPVLEAARRAADLGYSVAGAIRSAQGPEPADGGAVPLQLRRMWLEVALCVEVAERSGAPLADLLARYAVQAEAGLDSQAARDTALAGPQATVRLLTWLPVFGLGLGVLMGVDPLAVLLGTPLGLLTLAAGIVLMLIGRWWSSRMVAAAAGNG